MTSILSRLTLDTAEENEEPTASGQHLRILDEVLYAYDQLDSPAPNSGHRSTFEADGMHFSDKQAQEEDHGHESDSGLGTSVGSRDDVSSPKGMYIPLES